MRPVLKIYAIELTTMTEWARIPEPESICMEDREDRTQDIRQTRK